MNFDQEKKLRLKKRDRSIKKSIDKNIQNLITILNSKPDYYTTSSCSGRIVLLEKGKTKLTSKWLFLSHIPVTPYDIQRSLTKVKNKPVWFLLESFIVHICCRNIQAANKLLKIFHSLGLKRSGIRSLHKRIIIEIMGSETMHTLVALKGKILVSNNYRELLCNIANKKLTNNMKKIKQLEKKCAGL